MPDEKFEIKEELEKLGKDIDEKIKSYNDKFVKSEDYEALRKEIKEELVPKFEEFNKLQGRLDATETELKKMKDGRTVETSFSFADAVRKALEANKENIKNYIQGAVNRGRELDLGDLEAKADMTSADLVADTSNDIRVIPPTRVPGIVYDPDRAEHMRDLIPIGASQSNTITYPQETAYTDGSGVTAENVAYGETSFTITQQTALIESITAYATLSEIMLDDFPQLTSYINARLPSKLLVKEDDEILNGSGNVSGLLTVATAFAAGGYTVTSPNNFDVLHVALNQVRESEYKASAIVMHPQDVLEMKLTKDANENYVFPWMIQQGRRFTVNLVPVFVTTAMTEGTYLIGDFRLGCQLFMRKAIQLKFHDCDQDGTVTKGMKTVTITERIALPCYRTKAFVYDTFAASITELTV